MSQPVTTMLLLLHQVARGLALLGFATSVVIAMTAWGVRRGTLPPFGAWARGVRRLGDPLLQPIERRLHRGGGNPQDAPTWLIGVAVIGGLLLISLTDWIIQVIARIVLAFTNPAVGATLILETAFSLLTGAILIRVIGSFFGISRYTPWMRPVFWLTDWLLIPIQRVLPSMGGLDFSPMVAWFLLSFLRSVLLR